MRTRAASLAGAVIVLAACRASDRPAASPSPASVAGGRPSVSPGADRDRLREEALRAARVWRSPAPPIGSADLAANPPGPDSFRTDEVVSCTFRLRASKGWSPKFECALPSGEEVKVKYGRNSVEVFAEVAATRLLTALGFGADRMYMVKAVRCRGCPVYPYPKVEILDALRQGGGREVIFWTAAIERKLPGRPIRGALPGWTWPELDRIDPSAGGATRAEVDALRLMAVFLNHWDNKGPNQRLVCVDEGDARVDCAHPFAILQDVGQTFGPRGLDLDGWTRTRIWSDPAACRVSMKGLPYAGATFDDVQITEGGRLFLGDLLRQLSHAQIVALFTGARFPDFARQSKQGRDMENWAAVFESRVRQIVDRPPCPLP
jgi:hypothetical protein